MAYISIFKSTWFIHQFTHDNSPTSCSVSLNWLFRLQLYAPSKSWLISNTICSFWRFWMVSVTRFSCSLSWRPGLRTQNWPLTPKVFSRHWRVILFCDRPMYTTSNCAVISVGNWETATNSRQKIQNAVMLYFNRQKRESPRWANMYRALNAFTHMESNMSWAFTGTMHVVILEITYKSLHVID